MSSSPVRVTPSRTGHPPRKATPRSHQSVTPYRAIRQGRPRPRGCGQQRDSTHGPTRRVWQRRALSSTWAAQARERSAAPDDHPRRALPTAGRMRSARPGPDATKVDTSTKRLPMYRYIVNAHHRGRAPPPPRASPVAGRSPPGRGGADQGMPQCGGFCCSVEDASSRSARGPGQRHHRSPPPCIQRWDLRTTAAGSLYHRPYGWPRCKPGPWATHPNLGSSAARVARAHADDRSRRRPGLETVLSRPSRRTRRIGSTAAGPRAAPRRSARRIRRRSRRCPRP
jgi:hypothetical protein